MFGIRTPTSKPARTRKIEDKTEKVDLTQNEERRQSSVRRSIGEWESGKPDTLSKTPTTPKKVPLAGPSKPKPVPLPECGQNIRPAAQKVLVEAERSPPKQDIKYKDRLSEARACLQKAKLNLGNSRNIKTEIKSEVTKAIERLYQLVKEAEAENTREGKMKEKEPKPEPQPEPRKERELEENIKESEMIKRMEEQAILIKENNENMVKLKEMIERQQENQERMTYASVAAASTRKSPVVQTALHSVVVTSKDELETGEEVLERIREIVNAKEGDITVERIRKAKDSKIIMSCKNDEERQKLKEKLKKAEGHIIVSDMKNKDPLVILKDVFKYNSDEDILSSLRNQNKDVLGDFDEKTVEISYKKQTRNPHTQHVVMRVSPNVWQRMVDAGFLRIDLQRVRVADQSPLVQCSLCLGYGHGRRFCKGTLAKCSHCGGPHMRSDCADRLAGVLPSCCNCVQAKAENTAHNAFSPDCTIRRKWDTLARSTVAYC